MGSASAIRLELGVAIRKAALAMGGSNDDIELVLDERPDLIDSFGEQIVEAAKTVRSDKAAFRLLYDNIVIQIPALPRPTLDEIHKDFPQIAKIKSDTSPTGVATLRLATVLKSDERSIAGKPYEHRIASRRAQGLVLGYQHAKWLADNQDKPELTPFMALLGKVYVDCPGLIVADENGHLGVPYLHGWGGQRWSFGVRRLGGGFSHNAWIAVSSK